MYVSKMRVDYSFPRIVIIFFLSNKYECEKCFHFVDSFINCIYLICTTYILSRKNTARLVNKSQIFLIEYLHVIRVLMISVIINNTSLNAFSNF